MEGDQLVLDDPVALAVVRAVAKHNCGATLEANADRVAHFRRRIAELGRSPAEVMIVVLNVDGGGGDLAEILMPGFDWQAIRDNGEIPIARGLAGRVGIQAILDEIDHEAAEKLRGIDERAAVLVMDHGVAEIF